MPAESTVTYEVEIVRNVLIPTGDGELAADLYLPKGAPPVPALLMLLPYNKDCFAGTAFWQAHHYFARHGYASLLVDFRGTGSSSGSARAPFDSAESDDGVAAIEWAAKQPWCDGQVGMWGISYGGITSMRTASRRPPALKAIIPIMGHLDPEQDFVHPYTTRGCLAPLAWGLQMLLTQLMPPMHRDAQGRWRKVWEERLLKPEQHIADLLKHGPGDPAWRGRAIDASRISIPSLCVVGWRDLFVDGMVRAYEQIDAPKKLLGGPWMHVLPQGSPFATIDFLPMMRRWWDRWLRGIPNNVENEPPVTVFVQGRDRWRNLSAWPPAEVQTVRWFTGTDGSLRRESANATETVAKQADATIGVGAGLTSFQSFGYGMPVDQSDDDERGIAFTSMPLSDPLSIFGRAQLRLHLKSDQTTQSTLVAKLTDVDPDGRSVFISSSVGRVSAGTSDGVLVLELAPTCYEIGAGHRLRLTLSNGDFPRLWPDRNPPGLQIQCGGVAATELRVSTGTAALGQEAAIDRADPTADAAPHIVAAEPPNYQVTRDPRLDSVTVEIVTDTTVRSTDMANLVRFTQSVSASVAAKNPSEARFSGSAVAEITTEDGPISVRAEVSVTGDSATFAGEVVIDGQSTFTRRWTL